MRNALAFLLRLPLLLLRACLAVYRLTLSPDHGPLRHFYPHGVCRHTPTCSQYASLALKREPLFRALALIVRRVISCNPWTEPSEEKLREVAQCG